MNKYKMTIDDLIYSPIPIEEPEKTFRELCEESRKRTEDVFKHLRGKLFTRDNPDGSADVVHRELAAFGNRALKRELAKMRLRRCRRTQFGLRRY